MTSALNRLAVIFLAILAVSGCTDAPTAPLVWTASMGPYENIRHYDSEFIFCAANVSGNQLSLNSISCYSRKTGALAWRRTNRTEGRENWYEERGHHFDEKSLYLGAGYYDRNAKKILSPTLMAINLRDGSVLWEVPTWGLPGGITVDDSLLYFVSNDGRLGVYDKHTGEELRRVDLNDYVGPRPSYSHISKVGNSLIVNNNLSKNYTKHEHARTFILDASSAEMISETDRGYVHNGRLLVRADGGIAAFDLVHPNIGPELLVFPQTSGLHEAPFGAIMEVFGERGLRESWSLMRHGRRAESNPMGWGELRYVSSNTAYFLTETSDLVALSLENDDIRWSISFDEVSSIRASHTRVAAIVNRNTLRVLDTRSGLLLWSYRLPGGEISNLHCDDESVFLSAGRRLYYFGPSE